MTISSIHFQKAEVEFAEKHNFRTEKKEPEYLLDKQYRKTNEYLKLNDPKELYQEQLKLRNQNHARGFAPHIKDVYWEAVVNLDEKHSLADVKKVADFIQQKYHLQTCSIALHHDEGYKDKDSTVKYNHHAHLCFLTMDKGISTMRKIRSKELRQMQSEVAQLLGLERGKENSKATRLDHKQYREKAKELAEKDELYEKELYSLEQALDTAHDRDLETQEELLTLKEQKAIVEAERKKYKEEADHIASEYRALQNLNKTLHTQKELDDAIAALRTQYEDRLAKKAELSDFIASEALHLRADDMSNEKDLKAQLDAEKKNIKIETVTKTVLRDYTEAEINNLPKVVELNSTVKGLKAQRDYFKKSYNAELEIHQQLQEENKQLSAKLKTVTEERDILSKFNSTVLQVIQAMHSDFDLEHPIESLKKIYIAWKTQHQKSSITPQKRSQSDESTIKRVEVQQTSQSQSMSKFEASQPKEKLYTVQGLGYMTAEQIRAEAQSDDIGHFTSEEFKRALTADEFREVFGEPQQAQTPQKQSLFTRVKHSLER